MQTHVDSPTREKPSNGKRTRPKGLAHSVDSWVRSLEMLVRSKVREGFYGTVKVEMFEGRVKRVLVEESHVDPDTLARKTSTPIV